MNLQIYEGFDVRSFDGGISVDGPHLLILAGIHGDEFESIYAVQRLIRHFTADHNFTGKLTLIPIANVEAFRRGHRMATDEMDLARVFPGRSDGTGTEQVATALTRCIRSADLVIDLHTGGTELSVLPLTGYLLHPSAEILEAQRKMARAFNLPFIWGTTPAIEGRSISVARDAGIPAIYAEYLGGGNCGNAGIEAYYNGCLNVMAAFGMLERECPPSQVMDVVEDDQDGSGHIQGSHLAPVEGLFSPMVTLGTQVKKGEALGRITDFTGERSQEIFAEKCGRVIVLRSFPRVRVGDPCGVIA